jgi:LPXTG-motif cell wall-anchored protein
MNDTTIRFSTFPRTEPPPAFVEVEGKTWAIAEHVPRYTNSLLVRLPYDAVNYDKQRVTHAVNAPDVGSIWKTHGGWVARAEAVKGHVKIYHGLQSREEAIALVLSTAMEQLDAQTVPDTGGITPGTIALAGIVLLTGGLLLIWRIVLGWARF